VTRAIGLSAAAIVLFAWLATANSGGYRFGVSDQAFYAAAVLKAIDPALYPRDATLLDVQSRLMWSDEIVAALARALPIGLPALYFVLYLLGVAALAAAAFAFGRAAKFSTWSIALLLLFLTFRHRIAKTGANSLEGYMHPRMLAFALGVAALAATLRGRFGWAIAATMASAVWHPTTAFWFGIVVAAAAGGDPRWRRPVLAAAALVTIAGAWAVLAGPLAERLVTMDRDWLAVLADKDYLFPTDWPAYAWVTNLAYPIVIAAVYRRRQRRGDSVPGERAFVGALLALTAVFLVSVPFTAARLALAVQSQSTRVFWVLDFVAIAYVAWWLTADVARSRATRAVVIGIILAGSIGRGVYQLTAGDGGRDLVRLDYPTSSWMEAMRWLATQPPDWHVLADPGHAWKYGVSARLAARKDTVLESGKDSALAMYDRGIAMRVAERTAALGAYPDMTTDQLRQLDARYDLDVAIVEAALARHPFPELFRNGQFVVYDLR
jgi:hypothetical protein